VAPSYGARENPLIPGVMFVFFGNRRPMTLKPTEDEKGYLKEEVIYPDGSIRLAQYSEYGLMTHWTDGQGNVEFTYDDKGSRIK